MDAAPNESPGCNDAVRSPGQTSTRCWRSSSRSLAPRRNRCNRKCIAGHIPRWFADPRRRHRVGPWCKLIPCKVQQGAAYPNIGPINAAIAQEWSSDSHVLPGPDLSDLSVNADDPVNGLHFKTNASLACVAARWSQAIVAALFTTEQNSLGSGPGSTATTLTVTDGSNPIQAVACWLCSDSQGQTPVSEVLYTNAEGQVTFSLTTGSTYYLRGQGVGRQIGGTTSTPAVAFVA